MHGWLPLEISSNKSCASALPFTPHICCHQALLVFQTAMPV
jgi:hypothetical protein